MDQLNILLSKYFVYILVWELVWKGFALWKSAKRGEKFWFILILGFNTIGILPIIYIIYDTYLRIKVSSLLARFKKQ